MIKITKLNKYFYHRKSNEIHVINDVSIQFPDTGLVTILGESGCGKTTLLNVLGGLDSFYNGTIEYDNNKIEKYSWRKMDKIRNDKIGYIFQNYLLLPQRSVFDNLKLLLNMYDISDSEKEERIDYVLEAVGMLRYKRKNVSELSGGQQQRVAIARALVKSPSLILADEPTGNLDEKNTIQIMNIIKKISKNVLVILVSHEKNIATSYSDYIIEVSDGKITNQSNLDGKSSYKYEDDQNLYLKEFAYKKIENNNINLDFYSNEETKINLQIVFNNGKFYIKSSNDVVLVDKDSEIKMINEHKKELNASEEIEQNNFELKTISSSKSPGLSFKERISLALSNLKKLKKRTLFLRFPLFIISVLIMVSVQSVITASNIDRKAITNIDSRIYNISLEKGNARLNKDVHTFGFKYFCKDFIANNENIELSINLNHSFRFILPNFNQINNDIYRLEGFSTLTHEQLNEDSIIYGRMPTSYNEVVIEKWVIEKTLENSTIQNFMNISSFINKEIKSSDGSLSFTIVGIADNNENTAYFNKWILMNISPSNIKKEMQIFIPLSYYNKTYNQDIKLNKYEYIANQFLYYNAPDELLLNNDASLNLTRNSFVYENTLPYRIIISDEIYEELLISVLSYNNSELNLICINEKEKEQVDKYVDSVYDFYFNGELKANKENGFDESIPADLIDVYLIIQSYSEYDNIMKPYINEANKAVTSRLLITFTIVLLSILIVFFSMKSFAIKNIYDIGVFRAIGINKRSIIFVYAIQILIISLKSTLVGALMYYFITSFIASIPLIDLLVAMDFKLFIYSTFGMIGINVLAGILPIIMYLKKTPAQLLSKYDI